MRRKATAPHRFVDRKQELARRESSRTVAKRCRRYALSPHLQNTVALIRQQLMRYHDHHLIGYSVSEFGARIVFHLILDYPGCPKSESKIEFYDVEAHKFSHSSSAIILDIEELELAVLVSRYDSTLLELAGTGLRMWKTDAMDYVAALKVGGYRAWQIDSAVGFSGFIIAKGVRQLGEPKPDAPPNAGSTDTPPSSVS